MSKTCSAPLPSVAPTLDAAMARAEHRRGKLERLSDIGMELAEEIRERNVGAPYHPEPKHEPGRSFAHVSRAVRLTVVLEGKIDAEILAMSKGEWPVLANPKPPSTSVARRASSGGRGDLAEREARERGDESLMERDYEDEEREELLDMRIDECLAAIRAEFALVHGADATAVVSTAAVASQAVERAPALRTLPPGGAAAPGPVDDPPCAPTFHSRPAWPITGPPPT